MAERVKFTVALPQQAAKILDDRVEVENRLKPEILRRALHVYDLFTKHADEGGKIFFEDKKGETHEVVIL